MNDIQKKTYIDKDETDSMEKKQTNEKQNKTNCVHIQQESVRPRWPYDMRPSVRAEKYIRDASGW